MCKRSTKQPLGDSGWQMQSIKENKKVSDTSPEQLPIPTILTTNRYLALHNLQDDIETHSTVTDHLINYQHNMKATREKKISYERAKLQKKIVVIGDSHSRGLASELQSHLRHEYSVSRTILPGACLKNITQLAKNELSNLTRKDTIVIWGWIK